MVQMLSGTGIGQHSSEHFHHPRKARLGPWDQGSQLGWGWGDIWQCPIVTIGGLLAHQTWRSGMQCAGWRPRPRTSPVPDHCSAHWMEASLSLTRLSDPALVNLKHVLSGSLWRGVLVLTQELRVPGSSQGKFGMLSNGAHPQAWEWRSGQCCAGQHCDGVRRWAFGSDDGISALIRRGLRASSLCHMRTVRKRALPTHTRTAGSVILDFISRTVKNKWLLLQSPSLWYFVIATWSIYPTEL